MAATHSSSCPADHTGRHPVETPIAQEPLPGQVERFLLASIPLIHSPTDCGEILENRLKVWCAGISDQVTPGTTTVVEGAPGTGKTAALDDLAARWEASGRHVVRARGSALESDLPFGIVAQLFDLVDPDLVPVEALGALRLTAVSADFGVLHGVYRLAAALAGTAGLLVVVDDAHW